ncbi:phosphopantetheine-binding protein [Nocardia barduliensis]|uniref:phosphopantetheine-binding protein n=1 Tax=Nocardia barduliensis TaxID=2736643 RepID=UPI001571935E|nr:phosphopantetheine-binding protein [Nocardia barduliensis]
MTDIRRITSALAAHPDVDEATAFPVRVADSERILAVAAVSGFVTRPMLRQHLWRDLDDAEAASVGVLTLDRIPRREGSADLAEITRAALETGDSVWFHTPADELETELAALWSKVLDAAPISVFDDFLDLGGDSLAAIRIVSEIEQRFGLTLRLDELLDATVRSVAERITLDRASHGAGAAE